MKKTAASLLAIAIVTASYEAQAQTATTAYNQTVYDAQRNVRTTIVNQPLAYSADQYPTAQGHYLAAPVGGVPSAPAPVAAVVAPQPMVTAAIQPAPQPVYQQPVYQQPVQQAYVPQPVVQPQPMQQAYAQQPATSYNTLGPKRVVPISQPNSLKGYNNQQTGPAKPVGLGTLDGFEFGVQASHYRYQEHVVSNSTFMHLDGPNIGLTMSGNKVFDNNFFAGADLRLAYGLLDYTGGDVNLSTGATVPSTHDNEDNFIGEARVLGGRDFYLNRSNGDGVNMALSPYAGFGFRYLFNDGTGIDSNAVAGYRRYSQYFYVPVGITPRFRLDDGWRVSANAEYDQLIYGRQETKLNDSIPGGGILNNTQNGGFGIRGSLMAEWPKLSVGPFANYWNIDTSNTNCNDAGYCGTEPNNQTFEIGIQVKYRLDMGW